MCVGVCGVRGQLVVVFRNKHCFLWLDVAAQGGATAMSVCVCVCVCVCVYMQVSVCVWLSLVKLLVKVLNVANDLTMPPGAGPILQVTLFFSLFIWDVDRVCFSQGLDFSKIPRLSLSENISKH